MMWPAEWTRRWATQLYLFAHWPLFADAASNLFVFTVYHAFRYVVSGTYCENKVRTNPTSYQEIVFDTFGTVHGYKDKNDGCCCIFGLVAEAVTLGDCCTCMIRTRNKKTVPGERADIVINEAAKQTELLDNAYCCKSRIPPSTYVCIPMSSELPSKETLAAICILPRISKNRTCLMYHAACKVEFQPFNRSYSQLTFSIFSRQNRVSSIILLRSASFANKKAAVRTYYIHTVATYVSIPEEYQAALLPHHTTCTRYLSSRFVKCQND